MTRGLGIRTKLAITYLIISVPLVVVIVTAYAVGYREARQRLVDQRLEVARLTANSFGSYITNLQNEMEATGRAIEQMAADPELIELQMGHLVAHRPLSFACYVDRTLRIVYSTDDRLTTESLGTPPAFTDIRHGGKTASVGRITDVLGDSGFWVTRALPDNGGRIMIAGGFVSLTQLSDALSIRPHEGSVNIVDPSARVGVESERPDLAGEAVWAVDAVKDALAGRMGVSESFTLVDGQPRTLVEVPVEDLGWAAGSSVSIDRSIAPLRRTFAQAIGLAAIVLGLTLGAGALTVRSLARSFSALAEQSSRMGAGDLDNPIVVERPDEVGAVAAALEETRRRLKAYIGSVSDVADVGRELTASLAADEVKRTVYEGAKRLFGAVAVWIVVPTADGTGFEPFMIRGAGLERLAGERFTIAPAEHASVLAGGRPSVVRRRGGGNLDAWRELAARVPAEAVALAPLVIAERRIGVLGLVGPSVGDWRDDGRELDLLRLFASLVANALSNAALFTDVQSARMGAEELAEQARERAQELDAVLDSTGDPMFVFRPDGIVAHANTAAEAMIGTPVLGRRREQVLGRLNPRTPDGRPMGLDELPCAAAASLRAKQSARIRVDNAYGRNRVIDMQATPLAAEPDEQPGVVSTCHDITDLERSRALSEALNEVEALLGSTLEFGSVSKDVIASAGRAVDAPVAALCTRAPQGWDVTVTFGLAEDGNEALQDALALDPTALLVDHESRATCVTDEAGKAPSLGGPPPCIDPALARRLGIGRAIVAPIAVRNEPAGVLLFGRPDEDAPFEPEDLEFARKLARSIALAFEQTRLYAVQRDVSSTLQEGLLRMPERLEGIAFGRLYRSATETTRVGGDFFDLFEIEPGLVGVLIGDVSGKGLGAAAFTSFIKNTVRAYAYDGLQPGEVLAHVNDAACRISDETTFVTVFFAILRPADGTLTYCNAGHPPPILRRADGETELLQAASPMVAAFPSIDYECRDQRLEPGDRLLLYTDGVTEAKCADGDRFDEPRLLQAVHRATVGAEELPATILASVMECTNGSISDDVAVLALELRSED